MTASQAIQIGREMMMTAVMLTLPTILISLAVGLTISIFQTVTSIQEQTLSFAPRILAAALVIMLSLPWTLRILISFSNKLFLRVAESGH